MRCLVCGRLAPDDASTGYSGSGICEECRLDGWQEGNGAVWQEPSAQADGDPGYRLRCGWCRIVMAEGVEPETTGICEPCFEKQMADLQTGPLVRFETNG